MQAIKLDNVTFEYEEGIFAVNGISLEINQGEYIAVVGRNGSGKSTVAKLINGLISPKSGSVTVFGMDTKEKKDIFEIRKRVGMVFQNPDNQMVATIVEDDIAFGPENIGVQREEIARRIDFALKATNTEEFRHRPASQLSGGQKQRIAIAGVLAMGPDCIIFDEATSMLDPNGRKEITAAMKRLNREMGITVVTITHYMNEAVEADRIVVMNEGEIIGDGTPKEIFSQVEKLQSVSLSVPQVAELLYLLEQDGLDVPRGVLHTMDAAEVITKLYENI